MIAKFDNTTRDGNGTGLREYLENGTKNDRDLKDKRFTLYGDIDILEDCIKLGHDRGYKETYRNIVVSFSEDHVPEEVLRDIADQYIKQYCMGYDDDEYVAYAEAHLPKFKYKEITNPNTGEVTHLDRKPHIHITFALYSPKLDKQLSLNSNDKRIYDIDLLTRKIELEHGFEKPILKAVQKDITQYRAEKGTQKKADDRRDIKTRIDAFLQEYLHTIKSFKQLKEELIAEFNIKILNESTANAKTKSITIEHNGKKIRLKGDLFHDATFTQAKDNLLKKESYTAYKESDLLPLEAENLKALTKKLHEYNTKKIEEIKGLNTHARTKAKKFFAEYEKEPQTKEERVQNYISYQAKTYKSIYNKTIPYDLKGFWIKKFDDNGYVFLKNKNKDINVIDKGSKIEAKGGNVKEEARLAFEVAVAKGWKVKDILATGSLEFQIEIEQLKKEYTKEMQNPQIKSTVTNTEEKSKGIIEQMIESTKEEKQVTALTRFKKDLNPQFLYETFKLDAEKYPFYFDKEKGEYRIVCGKRKYNVVDFCIKEMHYNFKESVTRLEEAQRVQELKALSKAQTEITPSKTAQAFKTEVFKQLDEAKKEDLSIFASAQGYEMDKSKSSQSYRVMKHPETGDKIIISKTKNDVYMYYNVDNQQDKGTVYDFFKNRGVTDPKEMLKAIKGTDAEAIKANMPILATPKTSYNLEVLAQEYRSFKVYRESGNTYLQGRGISKEITDQYSSIKVDARNNVVTPMYAHYQDKQIKTSFALSGYNQKLQSPLTKGKDGTPLEKPLKDLNKGNKSITVLNTDKQEEVKHIVTTEAFIDGLSYVQANNLDPKNTVIISTNGQTSESSLSLVTELAERYPNAEVILAYDNDDKGKKFAESTKAKIQRAKAHFSTAKDWNEELQNRQKAQQAQAQEEQKAREAQAHKKGKRRKSTNTQ